jgi:hypothetical protein
MREQGRDLIPSGLAYRALQILVAFSIMQTVQFKLFPVIPEWLTASLMAIVPRYNAIPYDDFGIRGVQGWASEPAGAAMMCFAFSIVAIIERPDRLRRVFFIFILFLLVNKSVYALVMATLLGLCCLAPMKRKFYSLLAIVPMSVLAFLYVALSSRFSSLRDSLLINGMNGSFNSDLMRFVQILSPIQQFPFIYKPPIVRYDNAFVVMEPIGLFPLVVGYGSVLGVAWLAYILWRNFPRRPSPSRPLAMVAGFVLLFIAPPDLIPSVVALAVCLVPRTMQTASGGDVAIGSSSVEVSRTGGAE